MTQKVQKMKIKEGILVFLLVAYSAFCLVPSFVINDFGMSHSAKLYEHESTEYPCPMPPSPEQESSDTESSFSEDDENFNELPTISFLLHSASTPFHTLNNFPIQASLYPPFTPPEIHS